MDPNKGEGKAADLSVNNPLSQEDHVSLVQYKACCIYIAVQYIVYIKLYL